MNPPSNPALRSVARTSSRQAGPCDIAYFHCRGHVDYRQDPTQTELPEGSWVCEAALWTHWINVGRAAARDSLHLLVFSADEILAALQKHRHTSAIISANAAAFVSPCCQRADKGLAQRRPRTVDGPLFPGTLHGRECQSHHRESLDGQDTPLD